MSAQRLWDYATIRVPQCNGLNSTADENKAYQAKLAQDKIILVSNEPERLALPSPLPSLASAELALDELSWLVQRDPGKCTNLLLSIESLPFATEEIQMSAQDPSFNQAPVKVVSVCLRGTDK